MQLKTLLNHAQPFKGFVYKKVKLAKSQDRFKWDEPRIVVEIEPRKNSKGVCSGCGLERAGYDKLPSRLYDYLPMLGVLVYFAYQPRRVNCPECGIKVEKLPWSDGKNQLTKTLQWYLADWAKQLSWKAVTVRFKVSWDSVFKSVEMAVEWGLKERPLDDIKTIGVDEIAYAKGHKYLTLVYQIDAGIRRLLWIGESRTEQCFKGFFSWLGDERTANIEAVCPDMWKAYIKVIKEMIPNAVHILDRFHIVQQLNNAVDQVRTEEHKRLIKDGYEAVLSKTK